MLNKCYAVSYLHIVQLAIETMLSLSEIIMILYKSKEIQFLMQMIDKKRATDKLNMHTYYLLSLCILFSITCTSIICISNYTNYCAFSVVHINISR